MLRSLFTAVMYTVCAAGALAAPEFDVPRIDGVVIDGEAGDWGERGFRVDVLPDRAGRTRPPGNFDPALRLGWDADGLLVLLEVRDDVASEEVVDSALWDGDSAEIFLAPGVGADALLHAVIRPGAAEGSGGLRKRLYSAKLADPPAGWTVDAAAAGTGNGYRIEARLPWETVGVTAAAGATCAFQIYANDRDATPARFQGIWFPDTRTHEHTDRMYALRLADAPSAPVRASVRGAVDETARFQVDVVGVDGLAEQTATVRLADQTASAHLNVSNGRAVARLHLPLPAGGAAGEAAVHVGDTLVGVLAYPAPARARAIRLLMAEFRFDEYVFRGTAFPRGDFEHPLVVEELIGPYQLRFRYYDRRYNPVDSADRPGRYGAVVEVLPEDGRPFMRFQTLFRAPETFDAFQWRFHTPDAQITLPAALGIDPAVAEKHAGALSRYLVGAFELGTDRDPQVAALVSGLYEDTARGQVPGVQLDPFAMDRDWWVGLKRILYDPKTAIDVDFTCPRRLNEPPAPILREGTPEEAGMKAGASERIDAVLREWSADTDEAFAVCLARHGVVFLHRAYGLREGRPMTVDTRSWMASITKFLSGTLMMMLVDQGLVDLDAPVDAYLPALRYIDVAKPITVRHLYTHTNGLALGLNHPTFRWPDHWGDEMHDLEERIAMIYPLLDVGTGIGYNGVGYALGGKIIETVTGEALPIFFKNHLLDPLGMHHTDVTDGSAGAFSTAMDVARWGQMILNRGAYGEWRFFSEETADAQVPRKLDMILGPDTDVEWGIGTTWMREPGLSKDTFAHGAASSATFRIDLDNGLVIVMTRNTAGANFTKYHPRFIESVAKELD